MAEARQNAEALALLSRVLMMDPRRNEDRELFARLLHREGRIDESTDQYLLMLNSLGEQDDPRRAIKYCRQILADQPENADAHIHLCAVYERTGKTQQAFKECEWLADHYRDKGAGQQVETYARKALAWQPDDLGMRRRLIDLLIEMERTARRRPN